MSFLSVLKKIGSVFQVVATDAAPFTPLIASVTGAGSVFTTVMTGIAVAEQLITPANSGAQKKQLATAVINSVHPGLDQTALSQSIDGIVAIINQLVAAAAKVPTPSNTSTQP